MTNYNSKILVFILLLTIFAECCWSQITQAQDNSRRTCVPLTENINVQLSCTSVDKGKNFVVDCANSHGIGTIAKYKCKRFYVLFDQSGQGGDEAGHELTCNNNGKWSGLVRYESFRCKEDCGKVYKGAALVINGTATNSSQWPWHAAIFRKSQRKAWDYICGGTLIRNQIILTAAHCLVFGTDRYSHADNFRVVLGAVGSSFAENVDVLGTSIHSVQQIYISPNYDSKKDYQADIAVMHLKEVVQYSAEILPVCLPNDYLTDVNAAKPGVQGLVAGFGLTENGKLSPSLRQVSLTVKTNSECFDSLQTVLSESQLCAGGVKGEEWVGVCNGDSGGGLCFPSAVHEKYHIHGVTSSGDPGKSGCQNNAIFTRVYPFTFWVRDVIEEITGEIARELHTSAPYPYSLAGTETQPVSFEGLSREWENRITSLGVEYALVDEIKIRDSLAYAKPLRLFNLSHVTLQGAVSGFQGRVLLPHISTFYLDILKPDFRLGNDVRFPVAEPEREKYMQNLLFFDKNYDSLSSWDFSELTNLETNIDLRVHIFKLIHVHRERGELHLHQAPFADKVLQGTATAAEFVLRSLALRNCGRINIDNIPPMVEWLTVDHTQLNKYGLGRFTKLQLLSLSPSEMLRIDTSDLPSNSLRHLYLSKNCHWQHQKQSESASDVSSKISFPEQSASARFPSLETFCCDSCQLDTNLLSNFATSFPRVKLIVIKSRTNSTAAPANVFLQLQSLQKFVHFHRSGSGSVHVRTSAGQWESRSISLAEFRHQSFACSAKSAFWTSEVEFLARSRLTSFERAAYSSGHYSFTDGGVQAFAGIPASIQPALTSIHLQALLVQPHDLLDSIAHCRQLRTVTLANVTINGVSRTAAFHLRSVRVQGVDIPYLDETVGGHTTSTFPFPGPSNATASANILHAVWTNINGMRLDTNSSTTYLFDIFHHELVTFLEHMDGIFGQLPKNHPLTSSADIYWQYRVKTKPYISVAPGEWEWPGLIVADNVFLDEVIGSLLFRGVARPNFITRQARRIFAELAPYVGQVLGRTRSEALRLPNAQAFALTMVRNPLSAVLF